VTRSLLALPFVSLLIGCNSYDADFSAASRPQRGAALHAAIGTDAKSALDAVESYMTLHAGDGCIRDDAGALGGITTIDCPQHGAGRVTRAATLSVLDTTFEGWQPFLSSPVFDGAIQREAFSDGRTTFVVDLVANDVESHLEVTCLPAGPCSRTEGTATVAGLGSFAVRSDVSAFDASATPGVIEVIGDDTMRTDLRTDLRPDRACTRITIDGERAGSVCAGF
jgi:hypothetical protein